MVDRTKKKKCWFNLKEIWKNFKTIQWLPFKTQKDGTEGILKKFSATVGLLIISGLLFALIDVLLSLLLTYGGFNV